MLQSTHPINTRNNRLTNPNQPNGRPTNPPMTLPDSPTLYAACRNEDPDAYRALWDYLRRTALQVVYDQPDAEALAQECAQRALLRVHARLEEVHEPAAFRTWARRIAANLAIDELRRRKRLLPLTEQVDQALAARTAVDPAPPESRVEAALTLDACRALLLRAPMSDRSRRVVIGRFLDDLPDELLAEVESELSDGGVLPSHIQVTRAKNISKLRDWQPLRAFLGKGTQSDEKRNAEVRGGDAEGRGGDMYEG